jgi:hypothetical protein
MYHSALGSRVINKEIEGHHGQLVLGVALGVLDGKLRHEAVHLLHRLSGVEFFSGAVFFFQGLGRIQG